METKYIAIDILRSIIHKSNPLFDKEKNTSTCPFCGDIRYYEESNIANLNHSNNCEYIQALRLIRNLGEIS